MAFDRSLLRRFLQQYPFQPATALWRAVEITHVLHVGFAFSAGCGLDLGCGDGRLTQIMLERVGRCDLVGIDPDPAEIQLATSLDLYRQLLTASGARLPVADQAFDWVFSNSVLEHIEDLDPVLGEVSRVLKPHGSFLFTVPSDGFHGCLHGPLRAGVSRAEYLRDVDARCAHHRYWSIGDWQPTLARHGLSIRSSSRYLTRAEVRRWETVSRLTAGVLYVMFGRRKRPIEIQRTLGMRSRRARLPLPLAWVASQLITLGLDAADPGRAGAPTGGLLIHAVRSEIPTDAGRAA